MEHVKKRLTRHEVESLYVGSQRVDVTLSERGEPGCFHFMNTITE